MTTPLIRRIQETILRRKPVDQILDDTEGGEAPLTRTLGL